MDSVLKLRESIQKGPEAFNNIARRRGTNQETPGSRAEDAEAMRKLC